MNLIKKITPTCVKENIERKRLKTLQELAQPNKENERPLQNQVPVEGNLSPEETITSRRSQLLTLNNRELVCGLKKVLFGRNGELSLLLSLVFQLSVLRELNAPLKVLIEQILPFQFETYKTFSAYVDKFGGNPTLTDGKGNVWTGRNVVSSINPRNFVERAISALEKQIETYNRLLLQGGGAEFDNYVSFVVSQKQNQIVQMQNILS